MIPALKINLDTHYNIVDVYVPLMKNLQEFDLEPGIELKAELTLKLKDKLPNYYGIKVISIDYIILFSSEEDRNEYIVINEPEPNLFGELQQLQNMEVFENLKNPYMYSKCEMTGLILFKDLAYNGTSYSSPFENETITTTCCWEVHDTYFEENYSNCESCDRLIANDSGCNSNFRWSHEVFLNEEPDYSDRICERCFSEAAITEGMNQEAMFNDIDDVQSVNFNRAFLTFYGYVPNIPLTHFFTDFSLPSNKEKPEMILAEKEWKDYLQDKKLVVTNERNEYSGYCTIYEVSKDFRVPQIGDFVFGICECNSEYNHCRKFFGKIEKINLYGANPVIELAVDCSNPIAIWKTNVDAVFYTEQKAIEYAKKINSLKIATLQHGINNITEAQEDLDLRLNQLNEI